MKRSTLFKLVKKYLPEKSYPEYMTGSQLLEYFTSESFKLNLQGEDIDKVREFKKKFDQGEVYFQKEDEN